MQEKQHNFLVERDDLAKKLMEFEKWAEIENKYQLKEITRGVFVYESKDIEGSTVPKHWLCTNCFKDHKASILQYEGEYGDGNHYACPHCKTKISDNNPSPGGLSFGGVVSDNGWAGYL